MLSASTREALRTVTCLWGGAGLLLQTLSALSQLLWDKTRKLALKAANLCMLFLLFMPSSCRANPASRPGLTSSGQPSTLHFTFSWHTLKPQRRPGLISDESSILALSSGCTGYGERAAHFPKVVAWEAVCLQAERKILGECAAQ